MENKIGTESKKKGKQQVSRRKGREKEKNQKPKVKKKEVEQVESEELTETQLSSLEELVENFRRSSEEKMILEGLSMEARKYLHTYVNRFGMISRSYGGKKNRRLHVWWRKKVEKPQTRLILQSEIRDFLSVHLMPLEQELLNNRDRGNSNQRKKWRWQRENGARTNLSSLGPQMVPHNVNSRKQKQKQSSEELPICKYRQEFLELLAEHNVLIVSGETGSGKTSQVPQFILEEANRNAEPCRVFITQPRRIAAVSLAQRVSAERGEQVGTTVGYKIQLESCISRDTNLIYITAGSFLRLIMSNPDDLAKKTTHLILDEIHERDCNTDFAMIVIKDLLQRHKHLKVILMSATMDTPLLSQYFNNCPVLEVPGQSYGVKIYHLEEILYHSGYRTKQMEKYLRDVKQMEKLKHNSRDGRDEKKSDEHVSNEMGPVLLEDASMQSAIDMLIMQAMNINMELQEIEGNAEQHSDSDDICDIFDQILYYIESENVPINICHSSDGTTPLMVACKCNLPDYVRLFVEQHKANVYLVNKYNRNALDYAREHKDSLCLEIIHNSFNEVSSQVCKDNRMENELENEKQCILNAYQKQFNDENKIDHDLILSLLDGLYRDKYPGAILVFLPGYNDIMQQKELIEKTFSSGSYRICVLHGQTSTIEQSGALLKSSGHQRKIILSTNIAQTSITVPDLAFVIDAGKVKMNTFDCLTESSKLQSIWISQADACQRAGRAGRTQNGVCYRLYSSARYSLMSKFSIPEFMRIPLTQLCLYAKVLDNKNKVETFLSKALNPPSSLNVQNAIRKLKLLGVLNENESITPLGRYLSDIPVDVQLGICLLHGIFYRCIDSMLTICAYHSVRDPFVLNTNASQAETGPLDPKSLCGNWFSDQMGILQLYDSYKMIRGSRHKLREFCTKYSLSETAMDTFHNTRKQLNDILKEKFQVKENHRTYNYSWRMIQLSLASGFYPNLAYIDRTDYSLVNNSNRQLAFQRKSVLCPSGKQRLKPFMKSLPHDWIIFYEKIRLHKTCCISGNTMVPWFHVAIQCGFNCTLIHSNEGELNDKMKDEYIPQTSNNTLDSLPNDDPLKNVKITYVRNVEDKIGDPYHSMCIDKWIKLDFTSIEDVQLLMRLRNLLKSSFKIFLVNVPTRRRYSKAGNSPRNFDYFQIADFLIEVFDNLPPDQEIVDKEDDVEELN